MAKLLHTPAHLSAGNLEAAKHFAVYFPFHSKYIYKDKTRIGDNKDVEEYAQRKHSEPVVQPPDQASHLRRNSSVGSEARHGVNDATAQLSSVTTDRYSFNPLYLTTSQLSNSHDIVDIFNFDPYALIEM